MSYHMHFWKQAPHFDVCNTKTSTQQTSSYTKLIRKFFHSNSFAIELWKINIKYIRCWQRWKAHPDYNVLLPFSVVPQTITENAFSQPTCETRNGWVDDATRIWQPDTQTSKTVMLWRVIVNRCRKSFARIFARRYKMANKILIK